MTRLIPALPLAALLALPTALPAQEFDFENMTDAQKTAFGAAVRDYLLRNPQTIIDAVDRLEEQQREMAARAEIAMVEVNREALLNDGYSYVGGNPDGDVTIVEFLDYRCGYCRRAHPEVAELLETDGNIRIIVKELPILGPDSDASSRFAIAVKQIHGGELYKQVGDALMEMNGEANDAALTRLAESFDFDPAPVLERMGSEEVTQEIAETRALAQRLQINGTPSFVMGDRMVRGYVPLDSMRQIIAQERADG